MINAQDLGIAAVHSTCMIGVWFIDKFVLDS